MLHIYRQPRPRAYSRAHKRSLSLGASKSQPFCPRTLAKARTVYYALTSGRVSRASSSSEDAHVQLENTELRIKIFILLLPFPVPARMTWDEALSLSFFLFANCRYYCHNNSEPLLGPWPLRKCLSQPLFNVNASGWRFINARLIPRHPTKSRALRNLLIFLY